METYQYSEFTLANINKAFSIIERSDGAVEEFRCNRNMCNELDKWGVTVFSKNHIPQLTHVYGHLFSAVVIIDNMIENGKVIMISYDESIEVHAYFGADYFSFPIMMIKT